MKRILLLLFGITQVLGDSITSIEKEFVFNWRTSLEDHGNNKNLQLTAITHVQAFNDETLRIKIQNITLKDDFGRITLDTHHQDQVLTPFYIRLKMNQMKNFFVGKDEISDIVDIKRKFLSILGKELDFHGINDSSNGPDGLILKDLNQNDNEVLEIIRVSDVTKMLPIPSPAKEEASLALESGGFKLLSGNPITLTSTINEFQQEEGPHSVVRPIECMEFLCRSCEIRGRETRKGTGYTLRQCRSECEFDPDCLGIDFGKDHRANECWFNYEASSIYRYNQDPNFDAWIKSKAKGCNYKKIDHVPGQCDPRDGEINNPRCEPGKLCQKLFRYLAKYGCIKPDMPCRKDSDCTDAFQPYCVHNNCVPVR